MMFSSKRSELDVTADILRIGGSKTAIMYGANLSYSQTQKYLGVLIQSGLLERIEAARGRKGYRTTQKGQKFLDMFEDLEELVGVSWKSQIQNSPYSVDPATSRARGVASVAS